MIKVDNLNNLFWDNGTYKVPNTFPKLVQGKWLEKTTPVMITHLTGWIVLTGDWNYAEYKGNLFFLKKDKLISETDNKWRYILIKDQLCSILKNKANVIAKGTLINTDLEHLKKESYQFTLPAFSLFANRILLPLEERKFDWKRDLRPTLIRKDLSLEKSVSNKSFTKFINDLESNKRALSSLESSLNNNRYFCILGKPKREASQKNWKNQLREKINYLLEHLGDEEVVLQHIGNSTFTKILNCYTIGPYKTGFATKEVGNKVITEIDLSGLTDIKEINISSLTGEQWSSVDTKTLSANLEVDESLSGIDGQTYIKKLTRRVRLSFSNAYSTRASWHTTKLLDSSGKGNKYYQWFWDDLPDKEIFYPQKLFFRIEHPLQPKDNWKDFFSEKRKKESYRSVYLYYVYNWDFLLKFGAKDVQKVFEKFDSNYKGESNFVDPQKYFTGNEAQVKKELASGELLKSRGIEAIKLEKGSDTYYPWTIVDPKWPSRHINVGWLIGQFTQWDDTNSEKFHPDFPFLLLKPASELKRITGLNETVKSFIQNPNIYKNAEDNNGKYDLDIFNSLPARARHNSLEEDFLIGEKLLFWTWGLPVYLLFQPVSSSYSNDWIFNKEQVPLLWNYLASSSTWYYAYTLFDQEDQYLTRSAKSLFKKAYENFQPLDYHQQFYWNQENYKLLQEHIKKNTHSFFKLEPVNFETNTPFKEALKNGDIFYSDQEWYYFDASESRELGSTHREDFLNHAKREQLNLEDKDLVVYCEPTSHKLFLGTVQNWESEIELPAGQYIVTDEKIHVDHVDPQTEGGNKLSVKYTRIKKFLGQDNKYQDGFNSFDSLISALKTDSEDIFRGIAEFDLETLRKKNLNKFFLFDLVGTDFYCLLDKDDKVTLIVKEEATTKLVGPYPKQIYAIKANNKLDGLSKVQWVNQKVVLSVYGEKIDLPVKAIEGQIATIEIDHGAVQNQSPSEVFEPYRIEVKHKLGKLYYRLDVERKDIPKADLAKLDAFAIQDINIQQRRATQDYLINRERFELGQAEMILAHDQQRLEWAQSYGNNILGVLTGLAGGITGLFGTVATGGAGAIATGFGLGAISGLAKGISGLYYGGVRRGYMDRRFGMDIRQKNLDSYTIDLSFMRQKQDHRLLLKKVFSQIALTQASSRQRSLALDKFEADLEDKKTDEIYLEVWTASPEQISYLEDFHQKHGVDCRVPQTMLTIKNGIEAGVYTMEDVEIMNLKDRIDLQFLKARLEIGMRFINWVEHELVGELIPVDPRITKLQKALKLAEEKQIELEQDKTIQSQQIDELKQEIESEHKKVVDLNTNWDLTKKELSTTKQTLSAKEQQIKVEQSKYSSLSSSYRKKEQELAETQKVSNLYKDEAERERRDKKQEQEKNKLLTTEKEQLSSELSEKKNLLESTQQELQGANSEKKELETRNTELTEKNNELDNQLRQIREENQEYFVQIQKTIELLNAEKQDTSRLKEEASRLQETISSHTQTIEEHKGTISSKEEELEKEKKLNSQLQEARDRLTQQLEEKQREETNIKEQMENLQNQLRDTQTQLQDANREKENLTQEKNVLTEQATEQQKTIKQKEAEIEQVRSQGQTYAQSIQTQLDQVKQERDQLTLTGDRQLQTIQQNENKIRDLEQQVTGLTDACGREKADLTVEKDRKIKELENKLDNFICNVTQITKEYVVATCGDRNQRMVTLSYNAQKKAWVNNTRVGIGAKTREKQIKILQKGKPNEGFNTVISDWNTWYSRAKNDGYELINVVDGTNIGFPFFNKAPSKISDSIGCVVFFKDGSWYKTKVEGSVAINNYGEYLDALNLYLDKNQVKTFREQKQELQKQIQEKDETIKALRAIESELRTGTAHKWATKALGTLLTVDFKASVTESGGKTTSTEKGRTYWIFDYEELVTVGAKQDTQTHLDLYYWDEDYCCFFKQISRARLSFFKIWGYSSTRVFSTGYDLSFYYKFDGDEWKHSYLRSFVNAYRDGNTGITDWTNIMDPDRKWLTNYVGRWKIIASNKLNVPRIEQAIDTGAEGMRKSIDELKLVTPLVFNERTQQFQAVPDYIYSSKPREDEIREDQIDPSIHTKKITLYKEYLDFIGMKWDGAKKKAVPKTLLS